ncbi:hypothetical protein COOONC_04032, partial [Cooperia oncophora]
LLLFTVYNIAVQAWEEAVKEVLSAALPEAANDKTFLSEVIAYDFSQETSQREFQDIHDELNRQCEELSAEIVENRFIRMDLEHQLQEANDVIEVLSAIITQLQQISPDTVEDSDYVSSSNIASLPAE